MPHPDWPIPPIWPEHLPLIRELLSPRVFQQLLEEHPELQRIPFLLLRCGVGDREPSDNENAGQPFYGRPASSSSELPCLNVASATDRVLGWCHRPGPSGTHFR